MSDMRKIPVEELHPGMRFDKPLYIDPDNMLVGANISVKQDDIDKLMKWGIGAVETAGKIVSTDSEEQLSQKASQSSENHHYSFQNHNNGCKKNNQRLHHAAEKESDSY